MNTACFQLLVGALVLVVGSLSAQDGALLSLYDTSTLPGANFSVYSLQKDTAPAAGGEEARTDPRVEVRLELGIGMTEQDFVENNADGEADAILIGIQFEAVSDRNLGGGVRIETIRSQDFDGVLDADDADNVEVFGFFTYRIKRDRFRMALRPGIGFHLHTYDDNLSGFSTDYSTLFFRLEAEPELVLVEGRKVTWTVYGNLALGVGMTAIDSDIPVSNLDDETSSELLGFGLGTRVQVGPIALGLGYVGRSIEIDNTDDFTTVENDFSGVEFTVAVDW